MEIIVVLGIVLIYFVSLALSLAIAVLNVIAQWRLFEKAGEKGWAALIPMYNYFVMVKIATGKYTLGWVYLAISILYAVFSAVSSFILEFTDSESASLMYVLVVLASLALMIPVLMTSAYINYMFSKSYGKPDIWNVCMIFVAPILIIIMGFSKNTYYVGPKGIPRSF